MSILQYGLLNGPLEAGEFIIRSADTGESVRIALRRDTEANWRTNNPVLQFGEPGVSLDTGVVKLGDGLSSWLQLGPVTLQRLLNLPELCNGL
jgi:hypothetical protein